MSEALNISEALAQLGWSVEPIGGNKTKPWIVDTLAELNNGSTSVVVFGNNVPDDALELFATVAESADGMHVVRYDDANGAKIASSFYTYSRGKGKGKVRIARIDNNETGDDRIVFGARVSLTS